MGTDQPLRVALVCPYSLSRPGGVQGQVLGLARSLERAGHRTLVIAPDDGHPGWQGLSRYVAGRPVGVRANGSVAPVALSPAAAVRASRAVSTFAADVVHLHEPLAPMVGYGLLATGRRPLVGTFHRSGVSTAYRVAGPLVRWARGRLDVAVAVSEEARRSAAEALGGSYQVLFNGIEIERFAATAGQPLTPATDASGNGAGAAAGNHGGGGTPTVLFVGRHEHRKGLGVLLDAWDQVDRPGVLWVVGEGPETEQLRRAHPPSDRLAWLGRLADDELAARLGAASVLCAPSLGGESFGVVLLEAMAAWCRVVASDIPGYAAAAGGHAMLVAPGDPVALAGALTAVLDAPVAESVLAGAAAHAARWSMDKLAASYVDLYREAVATRDSDRVVAR